MNFFKRYLFKKAMLEDELANEERRKREVIVEQPSSVGEPAVVEPQAQVVSSVPAPVAKSSEIGGELHLSSTLSFN